MALELTGKIIQLLPPQSGSSARGVWNKQDFVIETNEQYPKKVCISAWSERAKEVAQIPIGTAVKVAVNIESREYNGKWYTDVRMWSIQVENASAMDPVNNSTVYSDMPPQGGSYQPQVQTADFTPSDAGEDLPF